MINRNLIAIDLAKTVFQVCRVTTSGKTISNKPVNRLQLKELLVNSSPSIVAFEACGSAHYWGRFAQAYGHIVRMLPPKAVRAFRQGHKTDETDAQAIAIAAQQEAIKSCNLMNVEQQTLQSFESSRRYISKQCRALSNHIRALAYEYGLTIPKGNSQLFKKIPVILEDADNGFPHILRATLHSLCEQLKIQQTLLKEIEKEKAQQVKTIQPCSTAASVKVRCSKMGDRQPLTSASHRNNTAVVARRSWWALIKPVAIRTCEPFYIRGHCLLLAVYPKNPPPLSNAG